MLLLLLACMPKSLVPPPPNASALRSELLIEGGLSQRLSSEAADLVVIYGGEQKGSMDTCGCPRRPRGSLPRLGAYVEAIERSDVPMVLVNPGYWLEDAQGFDGAQRADIAAMDRWMIQGMKALPWSGINLAPQDLAALVAVQEEAKGLPLLSANAQGAPPYQIIEVGGYKVGITGIAGPVPTLTDPLYKLQDPAGAGPVIEELSQKADVVILLSYQASDAAKRLAERYPSIDVVVDAAGHRDYFQPVVVGHAVWVYSHYQTMRLGELRLRLQEGAVIGALDRQIDLDSMMPEQPKLATMLRQAKTEIDALQQQLFQ